MGLSNELISQFVKATRDDKKTTTETTVYGTIVYDGKTYVKLDGSDLLTPITTTADVHDGERVTVMIKDHTAIVTGNISSPAARTDTVQELGTKISEFEIIIADKVSVKELEAEIARIDTLVSDNVIIRGELTAYKADITELQADNVTINEKLTAQDASIKKLDTEKLNADVAEITYATIEGLKATNADIYNLRSTYGDFEVLTTNKFAALDATVKELDTEKLSAEDAEIKYANIDFANIGEAAFKKLFSESGLIRDLVVGDGTITGELVGVTLRGDRIIGNTIQADKLVVKGSDGLYYKLNFEGGTFADGEAVPTDSLHGSVITAHSITAEKVSVKDLVAFDATIGGFKITDNSIYSGVKSSADNTTRGIYLDNDGQLVVGDASNYLKYFKDSDGTYKLAISAGSIIMSASNKNLETAMDEVIQKADAASNTVQDLEDRVNSGEFKGEDATVLRIDSSRGTVFKNSAVSTVLSAVIYHGSKRITDITALHEEFGNSAYLEWQWQRMGETSFGTILSTDSRIGDGGFTFTLSPEDVDTKVVFMCQLITD